MTTTDNTVPLVTKTGLPEGFLDLLSREQLAALHIQTARVLDDCAEAGEGTPLPIMLGGGPIHRCARCAASFSATTYHVSPSNEWGAFAPVCPRCADHDPHLHIWQAYCQVADMIDALMQAAPDKDVRRQLAGCLKNAADSFSQWRWPEDAED